MQVGGLLSLVVACALLCLTVAAAAQPARLLHSREKACALFARGCGNPSVTYVAALEVPKGPSITDFGAKCDGVTDDTAAFRAAQSQQPRTGSLYIPVGRTCLVSQSIYLTTALWSFPGGGTIRWKTDLGNGASWKVPADESTAGLTYEGPFISNIDFVGPNGAGYPGPGRANAEMDGVRFGRTAKTASQPFLDHVTIRGFHSGLVVNTYYGHWTLENSLVTANYYGIYLTATGGDAKILNNTINGNMMAGIACQLNNACLMGRFAIRDTHIGFVPYGIYVEPTDRAVHLGGFMETGAMDDVGFECIGNAAIKVATKVAAGIPNLANVSMLHPGFSWDNGFLCYDRTGLYQLPLTAVSATCMPTSGSHTLTNCSSTAGFRFGQQIAGAGLPDYTYVLSTTQSTILISNAASSSPGTETVTAAFDNKYAIDLANLEGTLYIDQGGHPFFPGSTGAIIHTQVCAGNSGKVVFDYGGGALPPQAKDAPPLEVVDQGDQSGCLGASEVKVSRFRVKETVPSGKTSMSFSSPLNDFAMSAAGFTVQCTPTSDPGSRWWVSTQQGAGPTRNVMTTTIALGTVANKNVEFNCRIN
jgi:parallel beta-helix repeat protein